MKVRIRIGLALAMLATPAGMMGQVRDDRDPFVELHRRLMEAVDGQLELARNVPRRAEQPPSDPPLAKQSAAGMTEKIQGDARQRFRELGVDAAWIFAEEGLGGTLLNVAQVESNLDPLAISPKGARGVWQLMPETALRLGLRVDAKLDERIDPQRATRAAARHLRGLYARFGEWRLALAAYNAGEGRVERAIEEAGTRDYARLAGLLPDETRRYVRAVLGEGGRE